MKKLLMLAAIAIAIWMFLNKDDGNKPAAPAGQAADEAAGRTPAPSGKAPPAAPAMPDNSLQTRVADMQRYAREGDVTFNGLRPEGGGGWIEVTWASDDTTVGANYIKLLIDNRVVRDLDVNRVSLGAVMRDGRRWWIGRYYVMF